MKSLFLNPVLEIFVASRQKFLKPGLKIERFHDKSLILGHFSHYVPFNSASLDLSNLSQKCNKKGIWFFFNPKRLVSEI